MGEKLFYFYFLLIIKKGLASVFIGPTHLNLDLHMVWNHPSTSEAY